MSAETSLMERTAAVRQPMAVGVKTILLHIQNDKLLDQRIQTALSLARACSAHLTCLHVTPIEAYVAFDGFGGVFVMNDVIKALDDEELQLRKRVEEDLRSEDASWDYLQVTGNVPTQIIRHAALADLIVVGREQHRCDFDVPAIGLLADLLHRSRTPLLVPGRDTEAIDSTGTAIIAWDASHEAANAVRAAVGLLKLASEVRVLQIREPEKDQPFPAKRLMEYLSRHDIHAELQIEAPGATKDIADMLVAKAVTLDAAYIVMGGYNHSRVGEYLFGGVTRTLLTDCAVPLFIAH
jgi:nucleotide-binding universal stress UspA family protein